MSGFGVVLVAVDDYPEPPGPLPSSVSSARFGGLVGGGRGGTVLDSVVATDEQGVVDALRRWATAADRPTASIVYLVGHGRGDGLDHEFLVPAQAEVVALRTARLAEFLQRDWLTRQADPASWTLFVLDCCDSELGVSNLVAELVAKYPKKPKRLGLWPVAPGGASRAGAFVDAFERALGTFTVNDTRIPLDAVFRKIRGELGDLESAGFLPDDAVLTIAEQASPLVVPLDVHAELRRAIADRPPEVRGHFLAKALGGEIGEVAWRFTGRDAEIAELCAWLHGGSGMRVVTGEAGSGKSALLGHLVVLADPALVDLYVRSGLAPQLATSPRPPDRVFAGVVHLTGKTALETVHDLADQFGIDPPGGIRPGDADPTAAGATAAGATAAGATAAGAAAVGDLPASIEALVHGVQAHGRRGDTLLVDALDESQEPAAIAALLHTVATNGGLRVLVGTRRSLLEGPDRPAAPSRRGLLDELRVGAADVLVVERDPAAVYAYAEQRLRGEHSPYADHPEVASALAGRIAGLDQPFLFARLATAELLARPALLPDDPALSRLLDRGHRGVFAAALDRIAAGDPHSVALIQALAHARGRGMPSTGGIWLHAAQVVSGRSGIPESGVEDVMTVAAPYITLDAEAGQGTYRLAHQTFVEHFRVQPGYGEGHRRIATAMAARFRADPEGWVGAGHYAVRYLPEHLVAGADRTPPDAEGLAALVIDAGWLVRAVAMLGVDRTVELIAAAHRTATGPGYRSAPSGPGTSDAIDAVERTLRRSRIAVARDPTQLPGLLHARLKDEPDPALAALGTRAGQVTGHPWLRMVAGTLDWRADLETTYGAVGKVRGLAFGEVGGRTVVAIAIDTRVVLWDPRQGQLDEAAVIDLGDHRATAVAVATVDGRPVVVTSAAYDGVTEVWDASTGDRLAAAAVGLGHCLAVGRLGDRLTIAGAELNGEVRLLDAGTLQPIEAGEQLRRGAVWSFAGYDGRLVALIHSGRADRRRPPYRIIAVDAADGSELWRSAWLGENDPELAAVAGGQVGRSFVAVAAGRRLTYWLTEDSVHVEEQAHGEVRMRALAVGSVDGRPVVASTPDYDGTAIVELREAGGSAGFRPRSSGGGPSLSSIFDDPPHAGELPLQPLYTAQSWRTDRPDKWPVTARASGVLGGQPVIVSGSVAGTAWVWDTTAGERPRPLAGPFATVPPGVLERGWSALRSKPPVPTADSVALGQHPDRGPVVAIACDGAVRLYTVPAGEPVACPAATASVVDAVDLGSVDGRDVLVTGSKGGVLGVWALAPPGRLAVLTLDAPIVDVRVVAGSGTGQVAARTGTGETFLLELRQ